MATTSKYQPASPPLAAPEPLTEAELYAAGHIASALSLGGKGLYDVPAIIEEAATKSLSEGAASAFVVAVRASREALVVQHGRELERLRTAAAARPAIDVLSLSRTERHAAIRKAGY